MCECTARRTNCGPDQRTVLTAFGPVEWTRRHFRCSTCLDAGYPADAALGIDGYLSPRIRRLACRLTSDHAFEVAADRFWELLKVRVDGETLRRHCEVEGAAIAEWVRHQPKAAETFHAAAGDAEIQVDAGKVNTTSGWRDMKMVVFAKRPRGKAATPDQWDKRTLPRPTARFALADIEGIETFRRDWRNWADLLGLGSGSDLSVLGDGAEWIWNAAEVQFPGSRQVLDVFHALESVGKATTGLYGPETSKTGMSFATGRAAVLAEGWNGVCRWVAEELAQEDTDARRRVLDELTTYTAKHIQRMGYRERLAEGRSIGSGLVEGTIKTMGLRMKARGARWIERNAEKMAAQVALSHSSNWDTYWALAS
jgi:hypothetical protein